MLRECQRKVIHDCDPLQTAEAECVKIMRLVLRVSRKQEYLTLCGSMEEPIEIKMGWACWAMCCSETVRRPRSFLEDINNILNTGEVPIRQRSP